MISTNIVGYCFRENPSPTEGTFDIGEFLKRIFLFDTVYLHSVRLTEVAPIIQCIGVDHFILLLKSGTVKFILDPVFITSVGQKATLLKRGQRNILPFGSYSFASLSLPQEKAQVSEMLSNIIPQGYTISKRNLKKLKLEIVENITKSPDDVVYGINSCMSTDLMSNNPIINYFIKKQLLDTGLPIDRFSELEAQASHITDKDFKISTNLGPLYGITIENEHNLVEGAIRALGNLNVRILEMASYDAISCFKDDDVAAFESRIKHLLMKSQEANIQESLNKVVVINGLPDFSEVGRLYKLNVPKLIKLKESDDYKVFRDFLHANIHHSAAEVKKNVRSFRGRLATITDSPVISSMRFFTNCGVGLIDPISGIISSVVDKYIFEKLLPRSGPVSIIKRGYPSLFEAP